MHEICRSGRDAFIFKPIYLDPIEIVAGQSAEAVIARMCVYT